MTDSKGITIVTLVVTIIILIILAGVSINITLGEEGIITIAKKAKENIELAQIEEQTKLNELYTSIKGEEIAEGETIYNIIAKWEDFKKKIADYIEEAGGIKPEYTANIETFGESILGIVKEVTKDATATQQDIVEGKTAWINGEKVTGNRKVETEVEHGLMVCGANGSEIYIRHNTSYTVKKDGILEYDGSSTRAGLLIQVNGQNKVVKNNNYNVTSGSFPVNKGDVITISEYDYSGWSRLATFSFIIK